MDPVNSSNQRSIEHKVRSEVGSNRTESQALQELINFIKEPFQSRCERCSGSGRTAAKSNCETCKGTGKIFIDLL